MGDIASIRANQNATFIASITAISTPREVTTSRGTSSVADATLQDATGTTTLTLWGDDISKYKVGSKIQIDRRVGQGVQGQAPGLARALGHDHRRPVIRSELNRDPAGRRPPGGSPPAPSGAGAASGTFPLAALSQSAHGGLNGRVERVRSREIQQVVRPGNKLHGRAGDPRARKFATCGITGLSRSPTEVRVGHGSPPGRGGRSDGRFVPTRAFPEHLLGVLPDHGLEELERGSGERRRPQLPEMFGRLSEPAGGPRVDRRLRERLVALERRFPPGTWS